MKIIVTTSDFYHHIIPVFAYLFNKYWGGQVELVGYNRPDNLPENFHFHSMGTQTTKEEWSTDLRNFFLSQDQWFIWLMEDTFIKSVDKKQLDFCHGLTMPQIGRICLTNDTQKREHTATMDGIVWAHPKAKYRQSTQPSIWNKDFLLTYLKDGLDPWQFETQPTADDYQIIGLQDYPVLHNEGVRRQDIHDFNLSGMDAEDLINIQWLKESYT
jgi:hypothetical protein